MENMILSGGNSEGVEISTEGEDNNDVIINVREEFESEIEEEISDNDDDDLPMTGKKVKRRKKTKAPKKIKEERQAYKIWLGYGDSSKHMIEDFNKLKKRQKCNSNFELMDRLLKVGHMAADELEKQDINRKLNEAKVNPDNGTEFAPNNISLQPQAGVTNGAIYSPGVRGHNVIFVTLPSPVITPKRHTYHHTEQNSRVLPRPQLSDVTNDYVKSFEEQVYERYSQSLQMEIGSENTVAKTVPNRKRKNSRKSSNIEDTIVPDNVYCRVVEQTKLMNEFALKEGVLTAVRNNKQSLAMSGTNEVGSAASTTGDETKKSVYIVNNESSNPSVLYSAHSKHSSESLQLPTPLPVETNTVEETKISAEQKDEEVF